MANLGDINGDGFDGYVSLVPRPLMFFGVTLKNMGGLRMKPGNVANKLKEMELWM